MKTKDLVIVILVAVLLVGGVYLYLDYTRSDEMTLEEAISIAQGSDCVIEGNLTESYNYNLDTQTWWIDLDIEKEGCAPACVIPADKIAEINWRCTGLIE